MKKQTMLYDYQLNVLSTAKPSYLYPLDTGTGKTILSLHHYLKFKKDEPLLIIAPPQKVKEGGWDRDIKTIEGYYNIKIEYETMSYGVLAKRYKDYKGYFVIFDECHYIKNPTSQRGKGAYHLTKQSTNFVLLSATPNANGWEDAINYFIMFGHTKNKTQFMKKYAIQQNIRMGTRMIPKLVGWMYEDELKARFKSFSSEALKKEDCLDLPPLIVEDVYFRSSSEYKIIKKDRVLEQNGELIAFDTMPKMLAALRYYANRKDKLKYVEMLVEGTTSNIVIFYNYTAEKRAIIEALKGYKVFEVSGQQNTLPPRDVWQELKQTVTLVQYQAGAAGIEMQYANIVIFYTPTYSYQDFEQALGRTYRNGQERRVTVYQFKTKGTIEEDVYEALEKKESFNEKLFGGEYE